MEGKGRDPPPPDTARSETANGHEPGPLIDSKNGSSPEEPSSRRGSAAERKNGDFEEINAAVSKVLASGACKPGQYRAIAEMAGITPLQAEVSVGQLRDRGELPRREVA